MARNDQHANEEMEAADRAGIGPCDECGLPAYVNVSPSYPWKLCPEHVRALRRECRAAGDDPKVSLDELYRRIRKKGLR